MLVSFPKFAQKLLVFGGVSLAALALATSLPKSLIASDHDDGEVDTKGRNLSLTQILHHSQ
jgi:hypothetical protein